MRGQATLGKRGNATRTCFLTDTSCYTCFLLFLLLRLSVTHRDVHFRGIFIERNVHCENGLLFLLTLPLGSAVGRAVDTVLVHVLKRDVDIFVLGTFCPVEAVCG